MKPNNGYSLFQGILTDTEVSVFREESIKLFKEIEGFNFRTPHNVSNIFDKSTKITEIFFQEK